MRLPSIEEVSGFGVGIVVGSLMSAIIILANYWPKSTIEQPEIKTCERLSLETTLLYVEKTEMFVDQLQRAKKGDRNQLIDSINHYRTLLKSSGNEIQY